MALPQSYPKEFIEPIRRQLQEKNIRELLTPEDVTDCIAQEQVLILINSVCGCAARNARPALFALQGRFPQLSLATVFAGVHRDATQALRDHISHPPSSPSFALFEKGVLVGFLPRDKIEGSDTQTVVEHVHTLLTGPRGI